jgi:hypothetical protein
MSRTVKVILTYHYQKSIDLNALVSLILYSRVEYKK